MSSIAPIAGSSDEDFIQNWWRIITPRAHKARRRAFVPVLPMLWNECTRIIADVPCEQLITVVIAAAAAAELINGGEHVVDPSLPALASSEDCIEFVGRGEPEFERIVTNHQRAVLAEEVHPERIVCN